MHKRFMDHLEVPNKTTNIRITIFQLLTINFDRNDQQKPVTSWQQPITNFMTQRISGMGSSSNASENCCRNEIRFWWIHFWNNEAVLIMIFFIAGWQRRDRGGVSWTRRVGHKEFSQNRFRLSDLFCIAVISEDSPIFWKPWQEQKLWIDRFELFCCTYSQNLVEQIVSC